MRIFYYIPFSQRTIMGSWQQVHFYDELARHGVEFVEFNPLLYSSMSKVYDAAVKSIEKGSYDLFFTGQCNEDYIPKELLLYCKKKGLPTLSIRFDNYVIPFMDEKLSPSFDLIWITSQETKCLYDRFGAKTVFAPYAANPYSFRYNDNLNIIRKACFIGTPHSSRANLINQLTQGGIQVDAFYGKSKETIVDNTTFPVKMVLPKEGFVRSHFNLARFSAGRTMLYASVLNKLKKQTVVNSNNNLSVLPKVSFEELPNRYSQYALSLAFTSLQHTDVLKNPIKIVDLRNFEIPMSGGIEFCRYHDEMASYFEENKEIVFYNTEEELLDKAKYYTTKASDTELRKMKSAARKRAEKEHTWYLRFSKVFGELGLRI